LDEKPELTRDQQAAIEQMEVSYKRPGVLTFIGVVLFIYSAVSFVSAIALFIHADDAGYQTVTGASENELLTAAFVEAAFGVLFFLIGAGIMSGWRWARLAVAVVVGFRLAVAAWYVLTTLGSGVQTSALIQAGISIFVLWILYGNDKSERFFGDKGVVF
jgi:hypothetical protein